METRTEWDDWGDIDMEPDQKLIHYMGRLACGRAHIFQPTVDPLCLANDVFDVAASHATNQRELDGINIDCIILASHGLDPSLPWKEYGLFGDDREER
eukprot:2393244-Rhodomonas_salina.1